jgi:hypothetical protein
LKRKPLNWGLLSMAETTLTGGLTNYYVKHIAHPQRQEPYTAECEDIIEALEMNPDEANIFKEIWRSAAARQNNGKPGHTALYGAEKIVHYGNRILRRERRKANATQTIAPKDAFKGLDLNRTQQVCIGEAVHEYAKQRNTAGVATHNPNKIPPVGS